MTTKRIEDEIRIPLPSVTCLAHPDIVEQVRGLIETSKNNTESLMVIGNNLSWLVRIGRWILVATGSLVVLLFPFIITFLIMVTNLKSDVAVQKYLIENKMQAMTDLAKDYGELKESVIAHHAKDNIKRKK